MAAFEGWRGVEAQHVVATMRLVDSLIEQEVLERLLEASKPALPADAQPSHFLAFTPFRYVSPVASRFRRAGHPGIWYGADTIDTACTELAYWGHALLMDSDGLRDEQLLTEFTVFPAAISGRAIDLTTRPWKTHDALWTGADYEPCQRLAEAARDRAVDVIRYRSARRIEGRCCAVLALRAIASVDLSRVQSWHRRVTREGASMIHSLSGRSISMAFAAPPSDGPSTS